VNEESTSMKKLTQEDGKSPNIVAENIERFRTIFPEVFADGKVDFDILREILGEYLEDRDERYSFTWQGKSQARRVAQMPSMGTLRPCPDESLNWDTTKNIFIEGDNLEVLKLLQKSYHRRVKMIYIDPPYNTGDEVVYPAGNPEGLDTYLAYTESSAEDDLTFSVNSQTSGRFHTNWLSMALPRLLLARNLLQDDGFLVASIDDHELKHLQHVLDEVFGEENRMAVLVLDRNRKNDAKFFSVGHEYVVVYAKDKAHLVEQGTRLRMLKTGVDELRILFSQSRTKHNDDWALVKADIKEHFKSIEKEDPRKPLTRFTKLDEKGPFRTDGDISWPGGGGPRYDVPHPVTGKPCAVPSRGWVFPTIARMNEEIAKGNIAFGKDEKKIPSKRRNLFEAFDQVMRSVSFSYAQKTAQEFTELFDGKKVFDNPKDPHVLRRLIDYLTGPRDIVLDLFAGSATTAHAVLMSNGQNNSQRRYICVQLPEPLDSKSKTGKTGIAMCEALNRAPTVVSIALERIRRSAAALALHESDYDVGYRLFRLDKSNIKPWDVEFDGLEDGILGAVEHVRRGRTQEDLAYELMLKYGLDLGIAVDRQTLASRQVFVVGRGALVMCFEDDIDVELIDAIADLKQSMNPAIMRVVLRDSALDDVLKVNTIQVLKQAGVTDVRSL